MKTRFIVSAIVLGLFVQTASAQKTYFVKTNGDGDGASWSKATNDLQKALKMASKGDQIWVAEGIYRPTAGFNRSISFEIPEGVQVFGGFEGSEKSVEERQLAQRPTILSGAIGKSEKGDNSYNVVTFRSVSDRTALDGFIVTEGWANGDADQGKSERSGGAVYIDGSKGRSNPTIRNCAFIDNFAKDGGAIFINARNGGTANPKFLNCQFENNLADLDGGAICCDGRNEGSANPTISKCAFEMNKGNYGGAVFAYGLAGQSLPTIDRCQFSSNSAYVKGGAVFHLSTDMSQQIGLETAVFSGNTALDHDSDDFTQYAVNESQFATR